MVVLSAPERKQYLTAVKHRKTVLKEIWQGLIHLPSTCFYRSLQERPSSVPVKLSLPGKALPSIYSQPERLCFKPGAPHAIYHKHGDRLSLNSLSNSLHKLCLLSDTSSLA